MFGSLLPKDPEALLCSAETKTGISYAGNPLFLEGFRRLHASFRDDAMLHPIGKKLIAATLEQLLVNRLKIDEALRAHPEAMSAPIERPVIILGMPRTGSTFLHRMLAEIHAFQTVRFKEAIRPEFEPSQDFDAHRTRDADDFIRTCDWICPELKHLHPLGSEASEECYHLLRHSFIHPSFQLMAPVTSYIGWASGQDMSPVYQDYRKQLLMLQAGRPARRWLLKSPAHWKFLPTLAATFPDAFYIHLHRHPADSLPSLFQLLSRIKQVYTLHRTSEAQESKHAMPALAKLLAGLESWLEDIPQERRMDVYYGDVINDPMKTVRKIAGRTGVKISLADETRVRAYVSRSKPASRVQNAKLKSPKPLFTRAEIEHAFSAYLGRHTKLSQDI